MVVAADTTRRLGSRPIHRRDSTLSRMSSTTKANIRLNTSRRTVDLRRLTLPIRVSHPITTNHNPMGDPRHRQPGSTVRIGLHSRTERRHHRAIKRRIRTATVRARHKAIHTRPRTITRTVGLIRRKSNGNNSTSILELRTVTRIRSTTSANSTIIPAPHIVEITTTPMRRGVWGPG